MEPALLICVRVAEMVGEPAQGSMRMMCTECHSPIWVASSSQSRLIDGGAYKLVCMQCAAELSTTPDTEPPQELSVPAQIEHMQAQAEIAYGQMYEVHKDHEIRWQFELADDLLLSAARLARKSGMTTEAEQSEKRRQHIRNVYYHQFVQPPRLLM
jgi:hypothetical protein